GLRGELVLPLQRLGEALQYLRELSGLLARAHQAHEHLAEDLGKFAERLRQAAAAFDRFDEARHHLAKPGVLDALAQVDEPFGDGHAGARQLLEVEAEVDEIGPRDAAAEEAALAARRRARHEVEVHAREALLEIEQ